MSDQRFDTFYLHFIDGEPHVSLFCTSLTYEAAKIMSGVGTDDFIASMCGEGWVGTRPEWSGGLPVVTVPHGTHLGLDQLEFMVEESRGFMTR